MSITIYKSKIGAEDCFTDAAQHNVLTADGATTRTVNGLSTVFLPLGGGTVTGGLTLSGSGEALTVTNNASVGGTFEVTGAFSGSNGEFTNGLTVSGGGVSMSSASSASLPATSMTSAQITGTAAVGSTLDVTGLATFGAGITVSSGTVTTKALNCTTTLNVGSTSTFGGTLTVSTGGLTVVSGTLNTTGATISAGDATFNDLVQFTKSSGTGLSVSSNASVSGTLTVSGGLAMNSHTLDYDDVDGRWEVDDDLYSSGSVECVGSMRVVGSSASLPTADAGNVGTLWIKNGDTAFAVYICVRTDTSAYSWATLRGDVGGTDTDLSYTYAGS